MDGVTAPSMSQSQVNVVCQFDGSVRPVASEPLQTSRVPVFVPQRAAAGAGGVERMRREAQLAALKYDEERQRNRTLQRDVKVPSLQPHASLLLQNKSLSKKKIDLLTLCSIIYILFW